MKRETSLEETNTAADIVDLRWWPRPGRPAEQGSH